MTSNDAQYTILPLNNTQRATEMTKRTIEHIQQMIQKAEDACSAATTLITVTKQDIDNLALEKQRLETIVSEEKKKKEESKKVVKDSFDVALTAATDGISKTHTTDDAIKHAKTLWSALKDTLVSAKENASEIFSFSDAEYALFENIPLLESELKEKLYAANIQLHNSETTLKIAIRKKKHFENQEKLKDLAQELEATQKTSIEKIAELESNLGSALQGKKGLEEEKAKLESKLASSEEKREQCSDKLQEVISKYLESQERANTLSQENTALTTKIATLEEQIAAEHALVEVPAVNNATESDAQ